MKFNDFHNRKLREIQTNNKKNKLENLLLKSKNYERVLKEVINGERKIKDGRVLRNICDIRPMILFYAKDELERTEIFVLFLEKLLNEKYYEKKWRHVAIDIHMAESRIKQFIYTSGNPILTKYEVDCLRKFLLRENDNV